MTTRRPKVFICNVHNANINIVEAVEKYGDSVVLSSSPYQVEPSAPGYNSKILESAFSRLNDYNPETDFIVPSGSPVIIMAVGAMLGKGRHRILQWSRAHNDYQLCELNIP